MRFYNIVKEKFKTNKLMFFVFGAIFLAILAVSASLWLYYFSGAAQLDLSRPSYQEAREQAKREKLQEEKQKKTAEEWNLDGNLTSKKLAEFEKIFSERMKKIEGDFFDQKTLSDETLNLTDENKERTE
ncbi:MAG: hypothetical protein Q4A21_03200 [bacterium]|nr:hypothetical protein [bacterium]